MTRRSEFLTVSATARTGNTRMKPVPIGGGGRSLDKILDLPLGDLVYDAKKDALNVNVPAYDDAAPITEKTRLKINHAKIKTKPAKTSTAKENFLDGAVTVRRQLKWKLWGGAAAALLGGTALADKLTGGEVALHTIDAAVTTADFIYRHTKPHVNVEEAIEWGVTLSQPFKFLHTDTKGVLAKNEAAIEAKQRFSNDPDKIREHILPALFTVDSNTFLLNYGVRNIIAIRNYPDMSRKDRGLILASALLKDIHTSQNAAAEAKTIPMSDEDILRILGKHPEITNKLPQTLRMGVNTMIADIYNADIKARRNTHVPPQHKGLQDWQIAALEAELSPMPTPEELRRSDEAMARAMEEFAEANRPKTLGELLEKQKAREAISAPARTNSQPRIQNITGKMQAAANTTAQAAPSPARIVWCDLKGRVMEISAPKCLMGQ